MAFIGTVYKLDGISHVKVKLDWRQSLDSETVQSSGMKKKKKSFPKNWKWVEGSLAKLELRKLGRKETERRQCDLIRENFSYIINF